jgi:hypothetical protein
LFVPPGRDEIHATDSSAAHDWCVADDALLIERLLRVVDDGRRTATYKLALLMALIDAAAVSDGSSEIGTRVIAEGVLAIYYPQTRLYVANNSGCRGPTLSSLPALSLSAEWPSRPKCDRH